jgi:carbonic anhydrase
MPRHKLIEGFNRFRAKHYESGDHLMEKLVKEGAHPEFFIINCIDPRNGADLVFDAQPGQEFIRSQMAAIIPPYKEGTQPELCASLSYAANHKKIKHIIVMGHSQCGGIAALVEGTNDPYIQAWVDMAKQARDVAAKKVGTANTALLEEETEKEVVVRSIHNLMEYPMIKKALTEGLVTINGWFFDMKAGTLHEYQPDKGTFRQLNKPPAPPSAVKSFSGPRR